MTWDDAIAQLLDAKGEYDDPEAPDLIALSNPGSAKTLWVLFKLSSVPKGWDAWQLAAGVLMSEAAGCDETGKHIAVCVVKGQLVTNFRVTLYPRNSHAFDLKAAWLEAKGAACNRPATQPQWQI